MIAKIPALFVLASISFFAAPGLAADAMPQNVSQSPYGRTSDGSPVEQYTLTNANGLFLNVITYGAIITEMRVPDRDGKLGDVVLGFDNLGQYLTKSPYFGSIIGRVGNRI